ncbi:zinc finger domain-containing protein [Streptomyces sp. NBC_00443]|uniref:zinc finger domain-containing protein n=1 Tax=Streptomyces sp. NBC_00443 TaxID=2975743 RepID=UPI002E1CD59B
MTEEEAVQIAEYVQAACPAQKFGEYTPDVWGEILAPYDVDEARAAVIVIAGRQRFIAPADIITEVKARRAERIELANIVYDGNPLETGAQSAAAIREIIRAAGDGLTGPSSISRALGAGDRLALPPGDDHGPYSGRAAAARAAIGKMPADRDTTKDPRGRACRRCGAAPGTSCIIGGRRSRDVHPVRLEDTKRAAAGLPLLDHDQEQARIRAASAAALAHEDQEQEAEAS